MIGVSLPRPADYPSWRPLVPFQKLPRPARLYIVTNVILGTAIVAGTLATQRIELNATLVMLVLVTLLANFYQVELTVQKCRMSLGNAVVFLTVMLRAAYRPDFPNSWSVDAVVLSALGGLVGSVFMGPSRPGKVHPAKTWYKPALSIANLVEAGFVAAWLWHWTWPHQVTGTVTSGFLAALLLMTTTYYLVNTIGIALAAALSQRLSPVTVWRENFVWTFPGYLYAVCAAAGTAMLYNKYQLVSFLLLPPMWVVYFSYRLYLEKINTELRHVQDLNELNERVISTLAMTIEAKDRYTHKHVERVREYALAIARELGVTGNDLHAIRIGAMVHDIGKIAVPEMILAKPGKLTPDEYERMKAHVTVGVKILDAVNFPFPVTDAVAAHHERWDGNGYPAGLKGEEIPVPGRIVALADGFDALTSDRHYRKRMTYSEALELIESQKGQQYDPRAVDALTRALPKVKSTIERLDKEEWHADQVSPRRRMIPQELLEEIARAAEEAVVLSEFSLQPNVSHSPADVMDMVLEKAMALLPATSGAVFILNETNQEIQVRSCRGLYVHLLDHLSMKMGEGVSGWVVAHGLPACNAPATGDLARRVEPGQNLELNSSLSVPLQAGGACMGTVTLYHTGYNLYNAHHQRLLTTLAEHAASALDTLSRLEISQVLAHTDSLTELPNARFLIQYLEELTASGNEPFSILLLDLNGFKQVNDLHGHLEGDRVLRDVAQMLRQCTRGKDLAARYAGDEFVVFCHGSSMETAPIIAERVRLAFLDYRPIPGTGLVLSASIGLAVFPKDGKDWRTLLSVADRRMYRDKLHSDDRGFTESDLPIPDAFRATA